MHSFVFIPNTLNSAKFGYVEGDRKQINGNSVYFITNDKIEPEKSARKTFIGNVNNRKQTDLNIDGLPQTISIENQSSTKDVIKIYYDYNAFTKSTIINDNGEDFGEHFQLLNEALKQKRNASTKACNKSKSHIWLCVALLLVVLEKCLNFVERLKFAFENSATYIHFCESLLHLKWLLKSAIEGKHSNQIGNAIVAKLVDICLGIFVVKLLLGNKDAIFAGTSHITELLIYVLKELLGYLMGSPIGLKLNYAFNHSLGTFFFYHISLWRVFLKGLHPILVYNFHYLILPGVLGFSFQMAMLSDIISMATFHVYCIYIYAARLFSLQIKGLVSLWRLFMGCKFNPLRDRIDSCDYSQNQLFIGTLGFTVLLFLLPTTTMYYTVFTLIRIATLSLVKILTQLRYLLVRLPIYVVTLWLFNSPSIAGTLYLKPVNSSIEARLFALPLIECVRKFTPYATVFFENVPNSSVSSGFRNALTGIII